MPRSLALALVGVATIMSAAEPYQEPYRPQFHFSPKLNWTNDPCGLVFANGRYHLFFQHNPSADVWGHMSWGHATSTDLVHWNQLPVAIPEGNDAIFTGSSVVDSNNTSGLCNPGVQCIVSVYTGYIPKTVTTPQRQYQNLAVSQDGQTWTKYSGNPVLDIHEENFRDPKVFWHPPSKKWIMVLVLATSKKVQFYSSPDLKNWKHLSDFGPQGATGGDWECPDLYQLPVDGDRHKTKWVLKIGLNPGHIFGGSGEQYFIGQFDGTQFSNENVDRETRWFDYGRDSYCALTFNGDPNGRNVIRWMNNWWYAAKTPTSPWRGAMGLPRSLALKTFAGRTAVTQTPVDTLHKLRAEALSYDGNDIGELNRRLARWPHRSQTFELQTVIWPGAAKRIVLRLLEGRDEYTLVAYDTVTKQLSVDRARSANASFSDKFSSRTTAPLDLGTEPLTLHIFVDRSSIEVFSGDGRVALTNLVFPNPESIGISLDTAGGKAGRIRVDLWKLRSIWPVAP